MAASISMRTAATILQTVLIGGLAAQASAGTLTTLHAFNGIDGEDPDLGVSVDTQGDVYSVTNSSIRYCPLSITGCGTVVKVDPAGKETTLVTFNGSNGAFSNVVTPVGGLVFGTAQSGPNRVGTGLFYSVHKDGTAYTILHAFQPLEGITPLGPLRIGQDSAFYGVAASGGPSYVGHAQQGHGSLYRLTATGVLTVLHGFSDGTDGADPTGIVLDRQGTIYGDAQLGACPGGGGATCSRIYRYTPATGAFDVLYTFPPGPVGPALAGVGADGTIYGSTSNGGAHALGSLFALVPGAGGYSFAPLFDFPGGPYGRFPSAPPALLADGTLIGTAYGTINPTSAVDSATVLYAYDSGTYKLLYTFSSGPIGAAPAIAQGTPAVDGSGGVVGASAFGGIVPCLTTEYDGCGTIYRVTP